MASKMNKMIRSSILSLYQSIFPQLCERAEYTQIGLTDQITWLDNTLAEERNLKPLSKFERGLLKPYIAAERQRKEEVFRRFISRERQRVGEVSQRIIENGVIQNLLTH